MLTCFGVRLAPSLPRSFPHSLPASLSPCQPQPCKPLQPNPPSQEDLEPLAALAPFVPRLLLEEIASDSGRYAAYDTVTPPGMVAASATLAPSMLQVQVRVDGLK
jgi:hypothetical protein